VDGPDLPGSFETLYLAAVRLGPAFAVLTVMLVACVRGGPHGDPVAPATVDPCEPVADGAPGCPADGKKYPLNCEKWIGRDPCRCEWMENDPTLAFDVVASVPPTIVRFLDWMCAG
jgi:hypothetical protein